MDPVAGVRDVLDVGVGEQPLDFWVIVGAGWEEAKSTSSGERPKVLFPFPKWQECWRLPDVRRTGSAQKERRSVVGGVKAGEAHDVFQVCRDGLQVDPPGVVTVLLHQVGEQELAHRSVLKRKQGGNDGKRSGRASGPLLLPPGDQSPNCISEFQV